MFNKGITVLGAGSWGTALAIHLARNDNTTCLWGHEPEFMNQLAQQRQNRQYLPGFEFPDTLGIESSLEAAVKTGRDVLVVVPSHAFREVLTQLKPASIKTRGSPGPPRALNTAAASSWARCSRMSSVTAYPSAVASGPTFAGEVAAGLPLRPDRGLVQPGLCQRHGKPHAR